MPIPFPVQPPQPLVTPEGPLAPPTTADQPYWLPDAQAYAIQQEAYRHTGAVDHWGEYAVFVLMWSIVDFEAGRVDRCPTCYTTLGLIADVYAQSPNSMCPDCFGTTFEGGFKAILVRRSLWDVTEEDERAARRGTTFTQTASVQSTSDFRLRTGDFIFREDGSRWQMRTLSSNELRTGFDMPTHESVVGYNYGTCSREDESSVAFIIPPDAETIRQRLGPDHMHYPGNYSDIEVIRGPVSS